MISLLLLFLFIRGRFHCRSEWIIPRFSLLLSFPALKQLDTFGAHAGPCQHPSLKRFPDTSRRQFKNMYRRWKCDLGRFICWEPDWGLQCRKRKARGRGVGAHTPSGSSVQSSTESGLYPAAHCSTAGHSHAGQLSPKAHCVVTRNWREVGTEQTKAYISSHTESQCPITITVESTQLSILFTLNELSQRKWSQKVSHIKSLAVQVCTPLLLIVFLPDQ